MTAERPVDHEILVFARELARIGGDTAMKWFRSADLVAERKSDDSPVTIADRTAEEAIRRAIAERYPDHGILGEEFGGADGDVLPRWIIDPIDGTKSFVRGVPLFTTLVAYEDSHGIGAGVIYAPATGEMVSAGTGDGAHDEEGRTVHVSSCGRIEDAWVMTTDPVDLNRREPGISRILLERAAAMRTWADAYGYLLLARGAVDAMIDPVMSPWDIAPLSVIIREAGGVFSAIDGVVDDLGDSAVATATPELHRAIIAGRSDHGTY